MRGAEFAEYEAFIAVADAGSFAGGAQTLGIGASAMSQIVRRLEKRLGTQLMHRTTRKVSFTDEGNRLLAHLRRAFSEIDAARNALEERREKPAGTVRIVSPRIAYRDIIEPFLPPFHARYPDVVVDVRIDEAKADIVQEGFDVGFRLGEYVHSEMVAFPVGPRLRQIAVACPSYLARHGVPQHPRDLLHHRCIGWREQPNVEPYDWEFAKDGKEVVVSVRGPLVLSDRELAAKAALSGLGIALWVEHRLQDWIGTGELVPLLMEWSQLYPGFHAFYRRDRYMGSATRAFVAALRVMRSAAS